MSFAREITMPRTKREGLENYVQIIINRLEAGEAEEAKMQAVGLLEDIRCGVYDNAMIDHKAANAAAKEMEAKHSAEIIAAVEQGRAEGIAMEKARLAKALDLAA